MRISDFLQTGKENATPGKALAEMLGLNIRDLTLMIEKERRNGAPICATANGKAPGYYLAANKREMAEYCAGLFHRAGELHKTRKECMKTIEKLPEDQE